MKNKHKIRPWLYSFPSLALILVIIVFPILYTGGISLTNMNVYHWNDYQYIGLENYSRALLKIDSGFITAIFTTIVWTILNIFIQLIISFLIAVALNVKGFKQARFYKTVLMFPWAMPAYVSILLWRVGMFNTEFGLFNNILVTLGLEKVNFLSNNFITFISCMVLNLWMALPFMIMMIDGALQSIDQSYYESATLEGAKFWKQCWYITVPLIQPIMMPAVIMTTFTTFKQFDILYLLTMQKGSYTGSTLHTIITYAHQNAFVSNNYGLSSAVSIVIFGFIIVFSLIVNRGIREEL